MADPMTRGNTYTVRVPSGPQELFLSVRGSGPAVVALHGLGASHAGSQGMAAALSDRFTVIAPDVRGHARSSPAQTVEHYAFSEHADDMRAILDHLGIERAAFTGYSYGADISLATALRHPTRVWAAVLIGNGLSGRHLVPEGDAPLAIFADLADRLEQGGLAALASEEMAQGWEQHDLASLISFLRGTQVHRPFHDLDELRAISAPVLVIPGNDPVHPRSIGEAFMTALPDAEWVELRMSMPPTAEDIETMLTRMRAFLETHAPAI